MLKKLAGLGCFALLLCLPLQAGHHRHRSERHRGESFASGFVEVRVGTPYGGGVFVRGFRPSPYDYYRPERDYYPRGRRGFVRYKYKHRRYFKAHRHYHYDGYCPY
jgi:hypothetical protein